MWRGGAIGAILAVLLASAPAAAAPDFAQWLGQLREEALASGISAATADDALGGIQPLPRVLELDQKQPEKTLSFADYAQRVVTPKRVADGRKLLRQHKALLDKVSRKYGVQPRFIVALWGLETNYGRITGGFRVIDALATLAYDGRRAAYFRGELLTALQILEQQHMPADAMKGSWAGAMGQCQFMPSAYVKYAQDWNGDGHRDIWKTEGDVFASAANYLSTVGWNPHQNWGREVRLPKGRDLSASASLDITKTVSAWNTLGVRLPNGKPLPKSSLEASLVTPDGPGGRAFLVYPNYRTVMNWNRSTYFATTVGLLADRLGDGR
jgi:membrane-bound lytic murein transglycosylase B